MLYEVITVCLIPTTIGGLLSAIGIAGMDRVTQYNVLAMSGKAVEAAGDVNTMILDKTGTITFGNRMAAEFLPVGSRAEDELAHWAAVSSRFDETPEGRSVIELLRRQGLEYDETLAANGEIIEFRAETRMSGVDLHRITSYNVCYTKLLRNSDRLISGVFQRTEEPTRACCVMINAACSSSEWPGLV